MGKVADFILLFLSQFAGGPGPAENNLVRFGLPAIMWAVLFYIAWSRQRTQDLPREKLLVWGFGLALVRELYMFGQMAYRVLGSGDVESHCEVFQPLEHGLAMAAMIFVSGAFLRYILDDQKLARHFLLAGIGITLLVFVISSWTWPRQLAANPQIKFHQTWSAWLFHVPLSILMGAAVFLLWRKQGWLRNVVACALTFDLISELLLLLNYATARAYNAVICPIGNSLHILAIPLLGYVYLHEQALEKKQADEALIAYRDHLEELVNDRTAEIAQRNASLATQNAVAATLSQSLEIEENLMKVLEMVRVEAQMEIGLIFLLDSESENLLLHLHSGLYSADDSRIFAENGCACQQISRQALSSKQTVIANPMDIPNSQSTPCTDQAGIHYLVSVPLTSKGRALGVMTLGAEHAASIQSNTLKLLTAIGQQIGMALENARLYKDVENWAGELSRLQDASSCLMASFDLNQVHAEIARQSAWLIKCQKVCVISLNEITRQFELAAAFGLNPHELQIIQDQLPGWVFLADLAALGRTTAIRDAASDMRLPDELRKRLNLQAALIVPIWRSESPQEFIFLLDVHKTRQWQAREVELIEGLSSRAAVALMNASLHHQLELAAALEERQRIAANMHDGLAQTLGFLGLRVDRMQELLYDDFDPEIEAVTCEIREVVANAAAEVRRSIGSLQQAPRPRSSFQDLIQDLLVQLHTENGPELRFDPVPGQALFVPPDQTDQVLPIIQEAVLNACRHSKAHTVSIHLDNTEAGIRVTIEDDGCGFDLNKPSFGGDHFGLSIMRARAVRIGGGFRIDTSPGNGTRITLEWNPESIGVWKSTSSHQKVRVQALS